MHLSKSSEEASLQLPFWWEYPSDEVAKGSVSHVPIGIGYGCSLAGLSHRIERERVPVRITVVCQHIDGHRCARGL